MSKYHREIKPGVYVDVYDVLKAFEVTDPALQHLVKKALATGKRGYKSFEQDLNEILESAKRAVELNKADKTNFHMVGNGYVEITAKDLTHEDIELRNAIQRELKRQMYKGGVIRGILNDIENLKNISRS